jgi:hypothetical protein
LILYAHSIDDIKDDDIDKIKKEDYVNFLLPATNWNNNLFYLNNTDSFSFSIIETDSHNSLNSSWSFAITVVNQYLRNQRLALFYL